MKLPIEGFDPAVVAEKVKLGAGVLGRTSPPVMVAEGVFAVAFFKVPEVWFAEVFFGFLGFNCLWIILAMSYAFLRPNHALMEGAELNLAKQLEMAASDANVIDVSPNENVPPPSSNPGPPPATLPGRRKSK